ncbi:MAG: DUF4386 domain-containing protein [Gemmatimonadales bacterium]|nr:DUF4386 domain-containing protein [Gemmatimonadales bacterium]
MSTPGLTATLRDASPSAKARLAGALYLLMIVLAGVGNSVESRVVILGDAAATAGNVLAHASLLRMGWAAYLVEMALNIAVTALIYDLFKPVDRSLARLAVLFSIVAITIKTFSRFFLIAPLFLLGDTGTLAALGQAERAAVALSFLEVNALGAGLAMVFFGFYSIISGYLIVRSTFMPRILGAFGLVAGLGWLLFLWLPLGLRFGGYVAIFALTGAVAKIGWFLVRGGDDGRWTEQERVAAASIWA